MLVFTKNIIGFKTVIYLCVCAFFIAIIQPEAHATIRSTTGTIDFDSNNDGTHEASLTTNGLAVGPNLTPSTNLHVQGNGIISESLVIGGTSNASNSTVHIHGTLSYGMQTLKAGGNQANNSIVLVDTSAGDVSIGLPNINTSLGQIITIKRTHTSNIVYISGGGGNVDNSGTLLSFSGNLTAVTFVNTGSSWVTLSSSEELNTDEIASSNLILLWSLDEISGNVIADGSSYSHGGNLTNNHSFSGNSVAGPISNALHLDDELDTALYDDGSLSSNAYTYMLWSKYHTGSTDSFPYKPHTTGKAGFVWASGNSFFHKSAFHMLSNGNYVSTKLTSELTANTWHHIAVSWDGSTVSLYLDGYLESGNTAATWSAASNIEVTNPGLTADYQSYADDIRFYNKSLNAFEIYAMFALGGAP